MIAILDYGAGNLTSVRLAFQYIGAEAVVTSDAGIADSADRIVFPGVGSAESGMAGLRKSGLDRVLLRAFREGKPILSVCLGMQMLLDFSEEDGGVAGLGLVPGKVKLFRFPPEQRVKIPHMGWNTLRQEVRHPLFRGIREGEAFYFVHSYYAAPESAGDCAGTTEYADFRFASVIGRKNLFATQFHPERSGKAGLQLLKNFTEWDGAACC